MAGLAIAALWQARGMDDDDTYKNCNLKMVDMQSMLLFKMGNVRELGKPHITTIYHTIAKKYAKTSA